MTAPIRMVSVPVDGQSFRSQQDWINRATRALTSHPDYNNTEHGEATGWRGPHFTALCFDQTGRRVRNGGDFKRATDEGTYPVWWVWPDQIPALLTAAPVREEGGAEDRFEQFVQAAIDNSPEPLKKLGEFLTAVLDEDHWPTAERYLLALATREEAPAEAGEVTADSLRSVSDETMRALLSCKDVGSGRAHLAAIVNALRAQPQAREEAQPKVLPTDETGQITKRFVIFTTPGEVPEKKGGWLKDEHLIDFLRAVMLHDGWKPGFRATVLELTWDNDLWASSASEYLEIHDDAIGARRARKAWQAARDEHERIYKVAPTMKLGDEIDSYRRITAIAAPPAPEAEKLRVALASIREQIRTADDPEHHTLGLIDKIALAALQQEGRP